MQNLKIGSGIRLALASGAVAIALGFSGAKLCSLSNRPQGNADATSIVVNVDPLPKANASINIPQKLIENQISSGYVRLKKKQDLQAEAIAVDDMYTESIPSLELTLPPLAIVSN